MNVFYSLGRWFDSKINVWLKRLQILSAIGVALASGTNDAQKTMGVITFSLILLGFYSNDGGGIVIPHWVIISCSLMLGIGIATGGRRIINRVRGSRKIWMNSLINISFRRRNMATPASV